MMISSPSIRYAASLWLLLAASSAHADYVSMNGAQLYGRFCAACHGASGHGDGPVSNSLKVEVPDLTLISRRQGGTFPADRIEKIIDGRFIVGAHGTRTMPIWGEDLSQAEIGNPDAERTTRTIIARLMEYLRYIQRPVESAK